MVIAGWLFLYSKSGKQTATTKGVKQTKCRGDGECVLLKVVIREGNSVPLSPAFARPCVCFKLLQALQPSLGKRVSVRHLARGKGEGGLFLPFVCVWEEE